MSKKECKSLHELLQEVGAKTFIYQKKKVNLNHERLILWA